MKLLIYSLIGCPFSMKSEKLLKAYNPTIYKVDQTEKDEYKQKNGMSTFPQIFLVDDSKNKIKIGGYDDTKKLLSNIFNNTYNEKDSLRKFFLNE